MSQGLFLSPQALGGPGLSAQGHRAANILHLMGCFPVCETTQEFASEIVI